MAAQSFHVLFHVIFKIFMLDSKILYINIRVYPKYWRLDLNLQPLGYTLFIFIYLFIQELNTVQAI